MAIGNDFVEESGWAISRIGARNGGADLGDCLKCRAWQRTRGPARASVGAVETPFPGVYIQIYYVRDGEHAFLTISPRTQKYEVF